MGTDSVRNTVRSSRNRGPPGSLLNDPQLASASPGGRPSRPVSTRFALLAGGLAAVVAAAVFFSYEEPWSLRGDNKLLLYPMTLDAFRQWMQASVPFWSNAQWGGFPLLADPTAGAFYFLNFIPYLLTPDPHYRAFDLATALHLGILVAGSVRLLGRFGACAGAACFGALLTLLAPHTLFWSGFLGGFVALAWWPWLMLAADALVESERLFSRSLVLGSGLLAAQQLAGHPELGLYSGAVATAWIVAKPSRLSLGARVGRASVSEDSCCRLHRSCRRRSSYRRSFGVREPRRSRSCRSSWRARCLWSIPESPQTRTMGSARSSARRRSRWRCGRRSAGRAGASSWQSSP